LGSAGSFTLNDLGTSTALASGDVIVLASATGITGTLNGYANNSTFIYGTNDYRINYGTLNGYSNDITLDVISVPEPSSWAMMLIGTFTLLVVFQRGKNKAAV
jgi:hypothetical protein